MSEYVFFLITFYYFIIIIIFFLAVYLNFFFCQGTGLIVHPWFLQWEQPFKRKMFLKNGGNTN